MTIDQLKSENERLSTELKLLKIMYNSTLEIKSLMSDVLQSTQKENESMKTALKAIVRHVEISLPHKPELSVPYCIASQELARQAAK